MKMCKYNTDRWWKIQSEIRLNLASLFGEQLFGIAAPFNYVL